MKLCIAVTFDTLFHSYHDHFPAKLAVRVYLLLSA